MISIIIPCYNHVDLTRELLLSFPDNTFHEYEIILIDDGSSDSTKQLVVNDLGISKIVHHETNLGLPKSTNAGINLAEGEYVAIFNNDMLAGKNWDKPLIEALIKYPSFGMVTGKCLSTKADYEAYNNNPPHPGTIRVWDKCLPFVLPICVQKEVGHWDEQFYPSWYDDVDIQIRLALKGFKFAMVEDSFSLHYSNTTLGKDYVEAWKGFIEKSSEKFRVKWQFPVARDYIFIDYPKIIKTGVVSLCSEEKFGSNIIVLKEDSNE